jgi:glycosyltransferase involved in cell wall biosynthesis
MFVFLFIFDAGSHVERKNPAGLIEAFKRAFRPDERALLILKLSQSDDGAPHLRTIQEASRGANIRITDRVLSHDQVKALVSRADCYTSLHRAEGFGLTMAEAMLLERPVIATGYSGNVDFMTAETSFLVRHTLTELDRDLGPYRGGALWAEPDLDHAAQLMRFVFEHREEARRVGRAARPHILKQCGIEAVGALIQERLEAIYIQARDSAGTVDAQRS